MCAAARRLAGPSRAGERWEQACYPVGARRCVVAVAVGLVGSSSRAVLASVGNALISAKQANLQARSQKNGRAECCRQMRFVFGDAGEEQPAQPTLVPAPGLGEV